MKRILCLLLILALVFTLSVQGFADENILFCRICGRQIPPDSRVCPYCGEKVVHVSGTAATPAPADNKTGGSLLADIAAAIPPLPAPSASPEAQTAQAQTSQAPAVAAPTTAPAQATDVKTALTQGSAPSPVTQTTQAAVPGPFNTTLGAGGAISGQVRVTKSPTSESVPYGGSCMFIAHAANATSVTWYIANSDASLIATASDAAANIAGLYVSGASTDTLYLSNIPSWLNGCQVQACFTGEGGPVYSQPARIWTYQPAAEQSSGGWSFWDWVNYYYWADPYLQDVPWWYWYDLIEDAPNPPDVWHSVPLPNGMSAAPELPGPGFIYGGNQGVVTGHTHHVPVTPSSSGRG